MQENKQYKVSIELLQEIANYLQKQPYNEVHEIMNKLILLTHTEDKE